MDSNQADQLLSDLCDMEDDIKKAAASFPRGRDDDVGDVDARLRWHGEGRRIVARLNLVACLNCDGDEQVRQDLAAVLRELLGKIEGKGEQLARDAEGGDGR